MKMSEHLEPTPSRIGATRKSAQSLRRVLTAAAATLLVVAAGSGTALAAPSPGGASAPTPATTPVTPTPTPGAAVTAPAPTHATPTVATAVTKAAAAAVSTRTAPTAALAGPGACGSTGSAVAYDLYALAGTGAAGTPLAGVPFWGFSQSSTGPSLPGPTLFMCEADTLALTLHNQLPAAPNAQASQSLSIELPAASGQPDTTGIGPGPTPKLYTFSNFAPGDYLYEAGNTPGGARQVAMGLSGLLIVRPTGYSPVNLSAYGTPSSQFVDEATLEVSEISTEFNSDPFGRDLHEYSPDLFLINGKAFDPAAPNTIPVAPGDTLLLHEANLGLRDHGMDVLGHRQTVLADDSHGLTNPQNVAVKWLVPGQVSDSFVTVDPSAQTGFTYPIFGSGFELNNGSSGGLGGMLAELSVATGVGGISNGPSTTNVSVSPTTNHGQLNPNDVTSGQITVSATFNSTVGLAGAEWFVDNVRASGSGTPITAPSGNSATVTFNIAWTEFLAALARDNADAAINGDHVIWVHARDTAGTWGTASGDVETMSITGPGTSQLNFHTSPTNDHNPNNIDGSNDLVVWATAQSSLVDWNVLGAYACIDSSTCSGSSRHDLFTNPPPTGPAYNSASDPAANYPSLPGVSYPAQTPACTPQATPGPDGGLPPPVNQPGGGNVVSACGVIPQADLAGLTSGVHQLYIRAYEGQNYDGDPNTGTVPGGWGVITGAAAAQALVIDRTGPTTRNLGVVPNPNNGYQNGPGNLGFLDSVQVTATLDDTASGASQVATSELFLTPTPVPAGSPAGTLPRCDGTTPPPSSVTGTGAAMVPSGGAWNSSLLTAYAYVPLTDIRSCAEGQVVLWVHAKDVAGNWGPFQSVTLTYDKTLPVISSAAATRTAGVVTLTVTANDPASGGVSSNIVAAEWFTGSDPGPGNAIAVVTSNPAPPPSFTAGNPVTFSFIPGTGRFPAGAVIRVRVKDAAGNWGAVTQVTV
jgi:FtsP/CotA-like multicopper oxidase with cupredoxin domain